MKKKKIGITYFLNKRLKPNILNGESFYPVYSRIVFNRSNTEIAFPSGICWQGLTDAQFNEIFGQRLNTDVNSEIASFEQFLEIIIRFEHRVVGDAYRVAGLSKKYYFYSLPICEEIERYIKQALLNELAQHLTNDQVSTVSHEAMSLEEAYYLAKDHIFTQLEDALPKNLITEMTAYIEFKAYTSLKEPLSFMKYTDGEPLPITSYDWALGGIQTEFKNFLLSEHSKKEVFEASPLSSPTKRFYSDFKSTPFQVASCLKSIDCMIISVSV